MSRWKRPGGKYAQTDAKPMGREPHVQAWCFICSTAHYWAEACPPVPRSEVRSRHEARK